MTRFLSTFAILLLSCTTLITPSYATTTVLTENKLEANQSQREKPQALPRCTDDAVITRETDSCILKVGISAVPPFAIQDENGNWTGISVDLWQEMATNLGYKYELVPLAFKDILNQLELGNIDTVIGAITMNAEREEIFDFSVPFYRSGLSIATVDKSVGIWTSIKSLFSWQFLSVIFALISVLMIVGALLWFFERKVNREQFGDDYKEGLGNSFWWAAVTMTTVGYGDKAPVSLGGRIIAMIWMFSALIMVSTFTAAVTTTLTTKNLESQVNGLNDLKSNVVATIDGTLSKTYLESEHIRNVSYPSVLSAMKAVQDNEAQAIVYDRPIMQYRNQQLDGGGLSVLAGTFEEQYYGFPLKEGSPLREYVNRSVLSITNSEEWHSIQSKYIEID